MKWLITISLMCCLSFPAYANRLAVTENGKTVILKDDGTWVIRKDKNPSHSTKNFRKTVWGMSKSQVKATESGKPKKEDDSTFVYVGRVSGMNALIIYIFAENKLVRAKYLFREQHSNENDYISDYDNLKKALVKKYGKVKDEKSVWRDDLYKDNYSKWGFAVSLGHRIYYSQWETKDTEIFLVLSGENYKIDLVAEYCSKVLKDLEKKVREKERAGEL